MIQLKPSFGVFITLNPGYAGRSDLPDNLKSLFRPVAMMLPDYALVSEVMLYAEGFTEAKMLSRKVVNLLRLSSEQLSQAKHYDFGMRAVKSALLMAGARKRARQVDSEAPRVGSEAPRVDSEALLLIRALCDSNVPKFTEQDVSLFYGIVGDVFPGVVLESWSSTQLGAAVWIALTRAQLQAPDAFLEKGIQLADTLKIRFGTLVLGMPGCGKSTLLYALAGTQFTCVTGTQVRILTPYCTLSQPPSLT
jgi:dynein heavy chain